MARSSQRDVLGSIKRIGDGKWRVRMSTPLGPDGRRGEYSEVVRGTRRDAELVRARFALQSGRGRSVLKSMTVYEFIAQAWFPTKDQLRASTLAGYRSNIEGPIRKYFGDVPMRDLLAFTIDQRLKLIEHPGSRIKVHGILRESMKYAVRSGFMDIDPMPSVPRPKMPRAAGAQEARDAYTHQEVAALLDYFRDDRIEAAVILGLTCGLRRSEICGLDWSDIRLPEGGRGELVIRRGYHGGGVFEDPKSTRSRRVVSIPAFATARLREIRGPHASLAPVLEAARGGRMSPDSLTGRWRAMMGQRLDDKGRQLHAAPVRYLPMKNLRHTHATLTLAAGVDVVDVSRRLGHSSVSVTDSFYLKPGREADEKAADAFDATFGPEATCRKMPQRQA